MKWAVIGAGYSGIAAAAAMLAEGIDVDVLDKRADVGGLWLDGVYPSVRLITTKDRSAYPDRPMASSGVFPSSTEMLTYLHDVAVDAGVRDRLINRDVSSVTPTGDHWDVDGERYAGVVLATGLFSEPHLPHLPGDSTIPSLHTSAYRTVGDLGDNVLVVGMGNSGADVAHDCVKAGKRVTIAVRRGRHIIPKRILGRPVVDMERPRFLPDLATRVAMDLSARTISAFWRRGRLAKPRHLFLAETPVIHSALLPLISNGSIVVRPGVARFDGRVAEFADGSSERFDTIVWATGYRYDLPVDRRLVDGSTAGYGASGLSLVGGVWSPITPGLACVGYREPRNGRGPYLHAAAGLTAAGARAQSQTLEPIGALLAETAAPTAKTLIDDGPEIRRVQRLTDAARTIAASPPKRG